MTLKLLSLVASTFVLTSCSEVTVTDEDKRAIASAISKSDNYLSHKDAFDTASAKLVKQGKCTAKDFSEMGGWVRSTTHKPNPVYFTYCGGMTISNRIYINTESREIFR